MGAHRDVEELRRALYRPGADDGAVQRYRVRAERSVHYRAAAVTTAGAAALAVALAAVAVLLPHGSAPDPGALAAQPAVRGALLGPVGFATRASASAGLPAARAVIEDSGSGAVELVLDRFGEVVSRGSRITVLIDCGSGRFDLHLDSVTQGRSQILLSPLAEASGTCGGVQRVRYRPLLGLLPTALRVDAAGEVRVRASID